MTGSLITEGFGVWGGVDELLLEGFYSLEETPPVTPAVLEFRVLTPIVTIVPLAAFHATLSGQDARRHVLDGVAVISATLAGQDARRHTLSREF
jgi:hypothetical protein